MSRRGSPSIVFALGLVATVLATGPACAQVTPIMAVPDVKPTSTSEPAAFSSDANWRFAGSVGGTKTTGNSKSSTINITGEAIRTTDSSKLNLGVRGLYAEANNNRTGANIAFSSQYDRDFTRDWFGFGKIDLMRDHPANIHLRQSAYAGLGYHVVRSPDHSWDLSGGVGYTEDQYVRPANVGGTMRDEYGRVEGVLSESSNHKLTETTSLRQKIGIFPNLRNHGEYRVVFDTGLSVAINSSLSLTAGMTYRYDSDPGIGIKKSDAIYVTGIGVKWD